MPTDEGVGRDFGLENEQIGSLMRPKAYLSKKTAEYLKSAMGLHMPVTPVDFFDERNLFTKLVAKHSGKNDSSKVNFLEMCSDWNSNHANGVTIFLKIPSLLQSFYTKHWKKSRQ
jgi:hypothetical protein